MTPYERYRNDLTGEGSRDPQHYLKLAIVLFVLGLALLYPIFCSGQDLPPGALLSETVLRISAGSSGTGTQPPFAPTTRPASLLIVDFNGRGGVDGDTRPEPKGVDGGGALHGSSPLQEPNDPHADNATGLSRINHGDSLGNLNRDGNPQAKHHRAGSEPARVHSFLPLALTYAGLQLVDGWQTTTALNSGRYREANGALSGIAGSPWKLGLVKGAVTSGSLLGIYAMRKAHPRASKWLLVGVVSAQAVVVGWNAKEMR